MGKGEVNLELVRKALENIEAIVEVPSNPFIWEEIFSVYGNKVDILPRGSKYIVIAWRRGLRDSERKKYLNELLKTV